MIIKTILKSLVAAGAVTVLMGPTQTAQAAGISQANNKLDLQIGGRFVRGMAFVDDGRSEHLFFPDGLDNDTEFFFAASGKLTEAVTAGASLKFDADQTAAQYSYGAAGDETVADDAEAISE